MVVVQQINMSAGALCVRVLSGQRCTSRIENSVLGFAPHRVSTKTAHTLTQMTACTRTHTHLDGHTATGHQIVAKVLWQQGVGRIADLYA